MIFIVGKLRPFNEALSESLKLKGKEVFSIDDFDCMHFIKDLDPKCIIIDFDDAKPSEVEPIMATDKPVIGFSRESQCNYSNLDLYFEKPINPIKVSEEILSYLSK